MDWFRGEFLAQLKEVPGLAVSPGFEQSCHMPAGIQDSAMSPVKLTGNLSVAQVCKMPRQCHGQPARFVCSDAAGKTGDFSNRHIPHLRRALNAERDQFFFARICRDTV